MEKIRSTMLFFCVLALGHVACDISKSKSKKNDLSHIEAIKTKYIKNGSFSIDISLDNNRRVKTLALEGLSYLPKEVFYFDKLETLLLKNMNLNKIPDLSCFGNLRKLYIINCNLKEQVILAKSLSRLRELTILSSMGGKINDIIFPEECQLEMLSLRYNSLRKIDNSFRNLKKIKSINLADNQLNEVNISYLKGIETLVLGGNPLDDTSLIRKKHKHIRYINF